MSHRTELDRFGRPVDPYPQVYPVVHQAVDFHPAPLHWLWPTRIPRGKLSLLIGDPGVGKSLLVADLAARVSAGRPWPAHGLAPPNSDRLAPKPDPPLPAGVVLVCPEDDPTDTLIPRLLTAGADLKRMCIFAGTSHTFRSILAPPERHPQPGEPFFLPDHFSALRQATGAVSDLQLIVLDPLSAVLSPGAQSNHTILAEAIAYLADLARRLNLAILAVGHLAKSRAHRTLYRVRGSLALVAAARTVHLLAADPDRTDTRIFIPLKNVCVAPPPPLYFRIHSGPRLDWNVECRPPSNAPASDLLDLPPDAQSALSEARDWLADALAAGPRPAAELLKEARTAGHSVRTLYRAKRLLGVRSVKPDQLSPWQWTPNGTPPVEDCQPGGVEQ